jgi:hypothetical protein
MPGTSTQIACVGCGALVPDADVPAHRYAGASPGCWAIFGEILSREYSDIRYARVHHLTVNAYAAQHPGTPSPRSITSAAVHLIGLHLILDRAYDPVRATRAMQRAASRKTAFRWLPPPVSLGEMTVLDVRGVEDPPEYARCVEQWTRSVWAAWAPHHATVRAWAAL